MNRTATAAVAGLFAFAAFHAVAADRISRQVAWSGSPVLNIAVPGKVTITQGPVARMVVTGPKSSVNRVYVSGDALRFHRDNRWFWFGYGDHDGLRVAITTPHLNQLNVMAGSNVHVEGLREDSLELTVHSGADVWAKTDVRGLSAKVHSGADLTASGRAERLDLVVHSGADAKMGGLVVDHADVRVHSGGDAVVNPRLSARAKAHSGGDIRMMTRPVRLDTETHSGGDIRVP